jgi:hypothetical protein
VANSRFTDAGDNGRPYLGSLPGPPLLIGVNFGLIDGIQTGAGEFRVRQEPAELLLVETHRRRLVRTKSYDCLLESRCEIFQKRSRRPFEYSRLALCQPDAVSGFNLARGILVAGLSAFLDTLPVELELIPPRVTTLVESHTVTSSPSEFD